jgi:hypothetical protein
MECALVGLALLLAGFLAGSAPAVGAQFAPLPSAVPQIITRDTADLTVTTLVQPARPGPNLVRVNVLETRRPSRGPVASVTVAVIRADGTVVATRQGVPSASGVVEWADVSIADPGTYEVRVRVDRPASGVPVVTGSWTIDPTPTRRVATVVSNRRWAAFALPLGGGWIALVTVGGWWLGRRRQGSKRYPFARTVTR